MAANKFATMLHRNTNKVTLILIYAVLEWSLIILLLLNSLFSYLIIKFAYYFGLKPPCLWCSGVDHVFEKGKNKNMHRDLLCEDHATEISTLVYCLNHRKLAESQSMCEDCLFSRPDFHQVSQNFTFFPWMKNARFMQSDGDKAFETDEVGLRCSCCAVSLDNKICFPCIVMKPSWDDLDYSHKGNLLTEAGEDYHVKEGDSSDPSKPDCTNRLQDEPVNNFDRDIEIIFYVNRGFGVREMEAEAEASVSVFKPGLKEFEGDEDDKRGVGLEAGKQSGKEEAESNVIMEDSFHDQTIVQVSSREDVSLEILPQHLEFFVDCSGHQLVPVDLIDLTSEDDQSESRVKEEDQEKNVHGEVTSGFGFCKDNDFADCSGHQLVLVDFIDLTTEDNQSENRVKEEDREKNHRKVTLVSGFSRENDESRVENKCSGREAETKISVHEIEKEQKFSDLESMKFEETENSLVFHAKGCDVVREVYEQVDIAQVAENSLTDAEIQVTTEEEERHEKVYPVSEEASQMTVNENVADVSIGTEIPDLEAADEIQTEEAVSAYICTDENPSTSSASLNAGGAYGCKNSQEESLEFRTLSVEGSEQVINQELSLSSELCEIDEDRIPHTPTSIESLHHLHKKLLLLEKDCGTEDSLDGSVISEFEGGDGAMTIERLKAALRAERKALNTLYAELEEERNASAVAANQTMAMINRLQEEKAAMQIEALQYQRMMEEQSEYDQEALQLLNELMVKREKEKQELEKELEIYRKKVLDYESKEKMKMFRNRNGRARSGTSSVYFSNTEDSDGSSIDLTQEAKEEDSFDNHQESANHDIPIDAVLNLESSLADFEEERQAILEQLKSLEEKLLTLDDEGEQHFKDVMPIEHMHERGNGIHLDPNSDFEDDVNGCANGFPKEMNGKHRGRRRIMGSNAKKLLPLFDAISAENGDGLLNGYSPNGVHKTAVTKFEIENKNLAIEEEVDHLYERLQALEADREFLKNCIGSLKKGDKGMDLLQEILQHLRDLQTVELQVRDLSDGALV